MKRPKQQLGEIIREFGEIFNVEQASKVLNTPRMIPKREILEIATSSNLTAHVIEKDYVLGWIMAGINQHKEIGNSWIFKGGTCLKKCYFETYRFSEDLDFTLRDEKHIMSFSKKLL